MLKLIQLGLSFTDGEGNWAEGCACWQFNFKFSLSDDMFAEDSIDLLKASGMVAAIGLACRWHACMFDWTLSRTTLKLTLELPLTPSRSTSHTLLIYLSHPLDLSLTPSRYTSHPPSRSTSHNHSITSHTLSILPDYTCTYTGIDFIKFETLGIDVRYFGELMMMSGLVLNDDVKWVSFHSSYDFGYLLKTLTCKELPMEENEFMELLHTYFPRLVTPTSVCHFKYAACKCRHTQSFNTTFLYLTLSVP